MEKRRLIDTLLCQAGIHESRYHLSTEDYCRMAETFANVSGGIAVISNFRDNNAYVYAGTFGQSLNMDPFTELESAFEDCVFSYIEPSDLTDRHILEIRFIGFIKTLPIDHRTDYIHSCRLNMTVGDRKFSVLHHTRYLEILPNGCIALAICTYVPFGNVRKNEFEGEIINMNTGIPLNRHQIKGVDNEILSRREREIMHIISEGSGSKQISDKLHISLNTVYRHRQNILHKLNAVNTAEAVKIGLRMHLI